MHAGRTLSIAAAAAFSLGHCFAGAEPLRTIRALSEFLNCNSSSNCTYAVTGVVTTTGAEKFIVEDASAAMCFYRYSGKPVNIGDIVRVSGSHSTNPDKEPWIMSGYVVETLGTGVVPPPVDRRIDELDEERDDFRRICVQGTVIDSFPDDADATYSFLLLKDGTLTLPIALKTSDLMSESLLTAHIQAVGIFQRSLSGQRRFSTPFLLIDPGIIEVISPPAKDPFAVPVLEFEKNASPQAISARGRRRISGDVIAVWERRNLLVRADDGRCIGVELANESAAPGVGRRITAVGYPETDLYSLQLCHASCRDEGPGSAPEPIPAPLSSRELFHKENGPRTFDMELLGRLVSMRGILRTNTWNDGGTLDLECDGEIVPVNVSAFKDGEIGIPSGSLLEVTGVVVIRGDVWTPIHPFPRIKDVFVVPRSLSDLLVLKSPPWWTPMRFVIALLALVAALIGFAIWNRIERRVARLRVDERTRLAAELHDALSQNLSALAFQTSVVKSTVDGGSETMQLIDTAERMLQSCRTELKNCLWDLRQDTLRESDFRQAIEKTLKPLNLPADVRIRFNAPLRSLPETTVHAVLCIIRELAANAVRHGHAKAIRIAGALADNHFAFLVRDDGSGFDPDRCAGIPEGHFGLANIQDRVRRLCGTLRIVSAPGRGTLVKIKFDTRQR